jgi:hypothetical protein
MTDLIDMTLLRKLARRAPDNGAAASGQGGNPAADLGQEAPADSSAGQPLTPEPKGAEGRDPSLPGTQKELDELISERLRRDREAQKKRADEKALEDQRRFEDLAKARADEIAELSAARAGLEQRSVAAEARVEALEKLVRAQIETARKGLPDHLTALLDKLGVDEQVAWLAQYAEKLPGADAPKRGTPNAGNQRAAGGQRPTTEEKPTRSPWGF